MTFLAHTLLAKFEIFLAGHGGLSWAGKIAPSYSLYFIFEPYLVLIHYELSLNWRHFHFWSLHFGKILLVNFRVFVYYIYCAVMTILGLFMSAASINEMPPPMTGVFLLVLSQKYFCFHFNAEWLDNATMVFVACLGLFTDLLLCLELVEIARRILRWFPQNVRAIMAKIKLPSMVKFWIKVKRSFRDLSAAVKHSYDVWH